MKPFFASKDCDVVLEECDGKYTSRVICPAMTVDQANRLLEERGKVVYSGGPLGSCSWDYFELQPDHPSWKHQALLINIEPIEEPDSADKLLREWIDHAEKMVPQLSQTSFIQRAKKLLGEK